MNKIICFIKGIWRSLPQWLSGDYPISGHLFVVEEEYENCRVSVEHCETCGKLNISWSQGSNKYR